MLHMIISSDVVCLIEKWTVTVLNKHMKQLRVYQVKSLLFTCGYTEQLAAHRSHYKGTSTSLLCFLMPFR